MTTERDLAREPRPYCDIDFTRHGGKTTDRILIRDEIAKGAYRRGLTFDQGAVEHVAELRARLAAAQAALGEAQRAELSDDVVAAIKKEARREAVARIEKARTVIADNFDGDPAQGARLALIDACADIVAFAPDVVT